MVKIMEQNPVKPVSEAIEKIILEAKTEYKDVPELLKDILQELGTDHGMEQRLYRIRERQIGKMPRNQDEFYPRKLLTKVHGKKSEKVLAKHVKWQHSNRIREEKRNKRKANEKRTMINEENNTQNDDVSVKEKIKSMMGKGETMGTKQRNSLCKVCGKEGNWTSITKHIEVHHIKRPVKK